MWDNELLGQGRGVVYDVFGLGISRGGRDVHQLRHVFVVVFFEDVGFDQGEGQLAMNAVE